MELEEIVDRYRQTQPRIRYSLVVLLALIPSIFYWLDEGDVLHQELQSVRQEADAIQARLESARKNAAELPVLLGKIKEIEDDLENAKRVLPDEVQIDQVLASIGQYEKELGVKVYKFVPGTESQPNPEIEYKEIPIDLTVRANFSEVMRFYDRILHMPNLTHLRSIQFELANQDQQGANSQNNEQDQVLQSTSKLILFKGM